MWMTSRTGSLRRIWGILKKSVSWVESCLGRRRLTFACSRRLCALRAPHEMEGGIWKSKNRKNVYLSPYVEEPLNSKVIKSFVPELRSRKCFSCFEIPMFYICYVINIYEIWTLYAHFTHTRIMGMVHWDIHTKLRYYLISQLVKWFLSRLRRFILSLSPQESNINLNTGRVNYTCSTYNSTYIRLIAVN